MTNESLAQSYLRKCIDRLDVLSLLFRKKAYSDVVREAQEIVELAIKGMLRDVGIEPPKFHDVGPLLIEHKDRYEGIILADDISKIAKISKELRKDRELAFYGDIDFIPTEEYTIDNGRKAIKGAKFVVRAAKKVIGKAR
ncbi:MAG: HEPN domain-containing protein [Nitrospirae bacterium]|nr:HEPN domain-containing protein [Nitrospirota bacterium]